MSSGVRRLNYTKRLRLKREHVTVMIHQSRETALPTMSAVLNLSSYSLPASANILVEAYRHTAWQRFDFGTVGAIRAPEDQVLRDFGAGEGLQFRVKIVEPMASGATAARILAQADGIKPNQDGPRRSLLPMDPDPSLRDEVWRLEIDEKDGPLVRVSTYLVRDRHNLARSPSFLSLAIPEILRRVLQWAINAGVPDDEEEWDTPRGRWIRLGCGLLSQREPPSECDDPDDGPDARDRWVDDVVARFCRVHRIDKTFAGWWREDTSQGIGEA